MVEKQRLRLFISMQNFEFTLTSGTEPMNSYITPFISDDHNILVPPSCGAAIAAVYSDILSDLIKKGKLPQILNNVVIIVCGGSGTTTEKVEEWRNKYM